MIRALLWDVDGTLAETERDGHRVAFNRAFAALGMSWQWDEVHYGTLLPVAGGFERIQYDLEKRSGNPEVPADPVRREALARNIHRHKHAAYAELVRSGAVSLREGVAALIEQAAAKGLRQGIVTTSGRSSVDTLLQSHLGGAEGGCRFDVLVCGDDVTRKKPHPEAYLRALEALALAPDEVLAVEDSPPGVAAARAAGIPVVLTRSFYFVDAPGDGTLAAGPGLHVRGGWDPPPEDLHGGAGITLEDLNHWRGAPPPRPAGAAPRRDRTHAGPRPGADGS